MVGPSYYVDVIKHLDTGYVRVSGHDDSVWAQLPTSEWDALEPGDMVPAEWTYQPSWARLKKPMLVNDSGVG
mgnify:CR=1 FL=1